ncbi:glycosyltransferase family 4 protein [Rurimicrobium arvi]|uniref:Uncharacterized protein n=1 Tax=Rurimicrobium arvi TaxID=2049916 RepID=A0ABP8MLZ4_9BACT
MTAKNLTYIVSDMSKMIALEWIIDYRDKSLTNLSFIFLNKGDSEIEAFVQQHKLPFIRIPYHGKKDLPKAIWQSFRFLRAQRTEIVHCHLFDACMVGLTAARMAGVPKRIFTRHYATYHHVYFPKAVKYDRFMNAMATDIVAISELVKRVLIKDEQVPESKVSLVHHGFLLSEYDNVTKERIAHFKSKYGLGAEPVIGVVARYTLLKGIQFIIPAFKQLLQHYPDAKLLIANSHGNDEAYLKGLMQDIPAQNIVEVKYERDMGALYKSLSAYVHVPIYDHIEAFGQTYVEALMARIPSVFTLSGVASEFIVHERNALVVPFEDAGAIFEALMRLLSDKDLCKQLENQGYEDTRKLFSLERMISGLEKLYIS